MVRGLLRPDLFTVVHEQFFTDTTDYADIVLPATTFFEHKDLQKAYGHYYLQVSNQAIEPLGECRSNVELFRALAERMGFEDDCFRETRGRDDRSGAGFERSVAGGDHSRAAGAGAGAAEFWARLTAPASGAELHSAGQPGRSAVSTQAHTAPFLPFAHGGFRTPSGKAELYSEALKAQGLDPVAEFTPPAESRHGKREQALPLELLARKADNFLNSTFSNVPSVQEMEEPGLLEICAGRRAGARNRRWRRGARLQSPGRYAAEGARGRHSSARSGLGETELGEADPGLSEH